MAQGLGAILVGIGGIIGLAAFLASWWGRRDDSLTERFVWSAFAAACFGSPLALFGMILLRN